MDPLRPGAGARAPAGGAGGATANPAGGAPSAMLPGTSNNGGAGGSASLDASAPLDAQAASGPPDALVAVPECRGSALSLDGTNFASVPRAVENDFTLEAWILTAASLPGANAFEGRGILDSDIIGAGNDFSVSVLNDSVAFGTGNPNFTLPGLASVTTNEWLHVAVTRQAASGVLRIMINGVQERTAISPNRGALSASPTIGFGGLASTRHFIGLIDEVKLWSVARSVEQIAANLRVRPSASDPGLVGYYSFEDQGTTETADGSALGAAATLTGGPVYVPSAALCPPGLAL